VLTTPSKVVIVFLMFYGRLAILPNKTDPAVDFTFSDFITAATLNKSLASLNDHSEISFLLSNAETGAISPQQENHSNSSLDRDHNDD